MTMDYGVFELVSDDDERTRRQRDASIRATRGIVAPGVYRPCGCKRRGRHLKVCPESSDIPHWRVLAERRKRRIREAGVLFPGF